jgi:hypothetical protein
MDNLCPKGGLEAWSKSPKSAPKVQKIALSHIRFSSPKPVRSGFSAASLGPTNKT